MLKEKLNFNNKIDVCSLILNWQKDNSNCPIYIWGAGSVASGVTKELQKNNIKIEGYFVDKENAIIDPRINKDKVILLKDLLSRNIRFAVVVGHSAYELVKEFKYEQVECIWLLTGVTREDDVITEEFVWNNIDSFEYTYSQLADVKSKENMVNYLNAKVTHNMEYIINGFEKVTTFFANDILKLSDSESYLDLGAYDGKSIEQFMETTQNKYNKIIAVEVMPEMYQNLKNKSWSDNDNVQIINIGISDHEGVDYFNFNSQSTCLTKENGTAIEVTTADRLCKNTDISLIKMCIGNSILPLLSGAEKIINDCMPKIIISAGIDTYALVDYIPTIEKIAGKGKYKFYLRFTNATTDCLVLFAIPVKNN